MVAAAYLLGFLLFSPFLVLIKYQRIFDDQHLFRLLLYFTLQLIELRVCVSFAEGGEVFEPCDSRFVLFDRLDQRALFSHKLFFVTIDMTLLLLRFF